MVQEKNVSSVPIKHTTTTSGAILTSAWWHWKEGHLATNKSQQKKKKNRSELANLPYVAVPMDTPASHDYSLAMVVVTFHQTP